MKTLDKALDFIVYLLEDDPTTLCEELHEHLRELEYCANNCQNFTKDCVKRYLKYYKKEEE